MTPHSEHTRIAVSTDLAGLGMAPQAVKQLYDPAFHQLGIPYGLEAIGFRHRIESFISRSTAAPIILGLHGSIGPTPGEPLKKQLEGLFFGQALISTATLVALSQEVGAQYVLVHQNELINPQAWQALVTAPDEILLFVENHPSSGSLARTAADVQALRQQGKVAAIMVDLLHLLKEDQAFHRHVSATELGPIWQRVLQKVAAILEQDLVRGFHLPIGTTDDAVPEELFFTDPCYWQELAQLLANYPAASQFLVIENQQTWAKAYLPPWLRQRVTDRNTHLLTYLAQCGLLPKTNSGTI